ncbi:MAG: pyruvate, phosphate dikinase [Bacteroidales bacterium]|nr:pyruvate, phosphate dikinase [Bacteroidales bacterium]MBQ2385677.1 pyruvate, phosphate dikinase [Bacteroidales bacterium]MEE0909637.1 pyruvate, phosphate dikinase [Bacteroidales bacterium]MEE0926050.1 pyruvate, phosphate dikinase [Bacteroidales bacterium]MEE0948033.1 pyruvate, phosphate dikinase [Bacteroidales bacterium]
MTKKYVYTFGGKTAEGKTDMKNLLGGKGANLAEMCLLGLPVPAGFTITTECCTDYYENNCELPEGLMEQVWDGMRKAEQVMGTKYGDKDNCMLVSCRSGARSSMPGMMDTVLNIGLCSETIPGLIKKTDNPRFVYDSYRRLIMMYADVVMEKAEGIEPVDGVGIRKILDDVLDEYKESKSYKSDTELTSEDLQFLATEFKTIIKNKLGVEFPDDATKQLEGGIKAVFKSWNGKKAVAYRRIEGIPDDWGTAVNVQAMAFGNTGDGSATGVAFTRNPATGENLFYGEWLKNAQGEDVVAGIRTPNPLNDDTKNEQNKHLVSMQEDMPETYKELCEIRTILENNFRDMLDIEFTIQDGKLYMLQCRVGKRTGVAALTMAMDMFKEGRIDEKEVIRRVSPTQLDELLHPILDSKDEAKHTVVAKGLPAGPGGALGVIALTSEEAMRLQKAGIANVLVREETNPEDVEGMRAADGILTARGGMTSHAALVARGWGKCCIVGCEALQINMENKTVTIGEKTYKEGDILCLNGTKGLVYDEKVAMINATENPLFQEFMQIVDKYRTMGVRTNADTPEDTEQALKFGAEGIGLFRIEHMFYGKNSEAPLAILRKMILSGSTEERKKWLNELQVYIKQSVKGTMKVMNGKPVTFRLIDPPLHEFVPHTEDKVAQLAEELGIKVSELKERIEGLKEVNPMMGLRGVRLGIIYPEISETQFRALFEAEAELRKEGNDPHLEIMVPLTVSVTELKHQKEICDRVHAEVESAMGAKINYLYGTMIEIPRATLVADEIATVADFFSFGTNDLTQMTFGFSRDDVNSIIGEYKEKKILPADPFQTLDQEGVGQLVKLGVERGRNTKPQLKVGVCGEHGGDPESVEFFFKAGMNYVSCSPFRLPLARLAAAQAAVGK